MQPAMTGRHRLKYNQRLSRRATAYGFSEKGRPPNTKGLRIPRDETGGRWPPETVRGLVQTVKTVFQSRIYSYYRGTKTTIDIPDDLLRLAKARASLSGISLRQFVTDMLRSQLAHEHQ